MLTAGRLRDPLIDGAVKASRDRGHRNTTRGSLCTSPPHGRVSRQMLGEVVAGLETDEAGQAAGALLKELGPDPGE